MTAKQRLPPLDGIDGVEPVTFLDVRIVTVNSVECRAATLDEICALLRRLDDPEQIDAAGRALPGPWGKGNLREAYDEIATAHAELEKTRTHLERERDAALARAYAAEDRCPACGGGNCSQSWTEGVKCCPDCTHQKTEEVALGERVDAFMLRLGEVSRQRDEAHARAEQCGKNFAETVELNRKLRTERDEATALYVAATGELERVLIEYGIEGDFTALDVARRLEAAATRLAEGKRVADGRAEDAEKREAWITETADGVIAGLEARIERLRKGEPEPEPGDPTMKP